MTDPLDDLRHALKNATPAPDAARRTANLACAQEVFNRAQEMAAEQRPTRDRPDAWAGIKHGVGKMLATLAARPALTAATAFAALGLVVLVPALRDRIPPLPTPFGASTDTAIEGLQVPIEGLHETAEEIAQLPEFHAAESVSGLRHPPAPQVAPMQSAPARIAASESVSAIPRSPGDEGGGMFGAIVGGQAATRAKYREEFTVAREDIAFGFEAPGAVVFANKDPNPLKIVAEEPVSTFSIDVDTASYSVIRSFLMHGFLPSADAVRIEEMINYFPYAYPAPEAGEAPFKPTITVAQTPWNPHTQLIHIALQGRLPAIEDRPPLNLVFLIDTSGSMDEPAKLPLLVQSFRLMLSRLRPEDQVAIVAYAGSAGVVLDATTVSDRAAILDSLGQLHADGSTHGAEGLRLAYRTAERMAAEGTVTRVILATDGDFNVGISDPEELKDFISRKRDSGIFLSVLGFGRGNLDDATMQALAQNGNGQAAYIDTLSEAQKVLVDQLTGALFPIANDVKIQVEFNPAAVAEYRLIGYETRALRREDFNNDKVDAGEIGAGHSVTAIYEITPVGSPAVLNNPLRYQSSEETQQGTERELAFLRLRYKEPGEDASHLIEMPIKPDTGAANSDTSFAAAMAGFGQLLRGGIYLGDWSYAEAISLAEANRGEDPFSYRREAVTLMRLAESLSN